MEKDSEVQEFRNQAITINWKTAAKFVVYENGDGTYVAMAYLAMGIQGEYIHIATTDVEYKNDEKTQFEAMSQIFNVIEGDEFTKE